MSPEAIFTGIGAILTGATGVALLVHEFRRKDRREMQKAIDELEAELAVLQHDYLVLRKFLMQISQLLIDHGIDAPEIPVHQ